MSKNFEIALLGDGGVGKSSITIMFCRNHFIEEYDPTIEDSYTKQIKIEDEDFYLNVLDTAGPEEYKSLRQSLIRSKTGFVLVYSTTCKNSFSEIRPFYEEICQAVRKINNKER
jgi:GTPase KRas